MGGRRLGRSEPASCVASTTALPPSTCTARQEAGQLLRLLFCCEAGQLHLLAGCFLQGLCRSDRPPAGLPAAALFCRFVCRSTFAMPCLPPLPSMPTAHVHQPPFCLLCPPPLFIAMCARIKPTVCKLQDCLVGSYNTGLQWRPVRRFLTAFSLQSP